LIVGDSQAAGPAGRIVEQTFAAEGIPVQRIGHVGHGAYDWTRMHWDEYMAAVRSVRPDHVIMIFGGNDPPDERLAHAFRQFQQTAPNVWYAGPPRYDARPDLQLRSNNLRNLARRVFGSKHLDAWPYSGPEVPRAGDNVHFGPAGGRLWAEGILRDWRAALEGAVRGTPVWVGPTILGSAAVVLLGLWWWSRR
jgi:hypothetical protein